MSDWKSRATSVDAGGTNGWKSRAAAQAPAQEAPQPEGNPAQAALEGFGQTASMGYLPQLQAAAEHYLSADPSNGSDDALRKAGFNVPEHSYVQARDQNIAREKMLEKANPTATMAGKAAGIGASIALPAGAAGLAGKVAPVLGDVATIAGQAMPTGVKGAALSGALQGAAYNPGDKTGEVDPVQASDRLKGLLLGGAVGGGTAGVASGAMAGADKLMQSAAGIRKKLPGLGNELVSQGVGGTKGMINKQVTALLPKTEDRLQNAIKGVEGDLSLGPVADAISAKAEKFSPGGMTPMNMVGPKGQYEQMAEQLAMKDRMDAPGLLGFKRLQGAEAHTQAGNVANTHGAELADTAQKAADDVLSKAAGPEYDAANKTFTAALRAKRGTELSPSLTDQLITGGLGAAGLASGGPLGVLLAAANTAAGKSAMAHGLQRVVAPSAAKAGPALQRGLFEETREE